MLKSLAWTTAQFSTFLYAAHTTILLSQSSEKSLTLARNNLYLVAPFQYLQKTDRVVELRWVFIST